MKFIIFFSKFNRSSSSKALARDNMGTLCFTFKKFFEGLCPTILEGDFSELRYLYFFSNKRISFLTSSYSLSETRGELSL